MAVVAIGAVVVVLLWWWLRLHARIEAFDFDFEISVHMHTWFIMERDARYDICDIIIYFYLHLKYIIRIINRVLNLII